MTILAIGSVVELSYPEGNEYLIVESRRENKIYFNWLTKNTSISSGIWTREIWINAHEVHLYEFRFLEEHEALAAILKSKL